MLHDLLTLRCTPLFVAPGLLTGLGIFQNHENLLARYAELAPVHNNNRHKDCSFSHFHFYNLWLHTRPIHAYAQGFSLSVLTLGSLGKVCLTNPYYAAVSEGLATGRYRNPRLLYSMLAIVPLPLSLSM